MIVKPVKKQNSMQKPKLFAMDVQWSIKSKGISQGSSEKVGNGKTKTKLNTHNSLSEVKCTWQPKPRFGHTSEMEPGCRNQMLTCVSQTSVNQWFLVFQENRW